MINDRPHFCFIRPKKRLGWTCPFKKEIHLQPWENEHKHTYSCIAKKPTSSPWWGLHKSEESVIPGGGGRALLSSRNFPQMESPSLPCCHPTGDCCLGDKLEFDDWLAAGEWLSGDPLLTPLLALDSTVSFLLGRYDSRMSQSEATSMLRGDAESLLWENTCITLLEKWTWNYGVKIYRIWSWPHHKTSPRCYIIMPDETKRM